MYAFLSALPPAWHTTPMAALATLFEAIRSRRLKNTNMGCLWPDLNLPDTILNDKELVDAAQACTPMLAQLDATAQLHCELRLPPSVHISKQVVSFSELQCAVSYWSQQLASLTVTRTNDQRSIQLVCDALRSLPALRRLVVLWHPAAQPKETLTLLDALDFSNVTELRLHYNLANPVQWTATEVKALVRWLQAKPVTSISLVDVSIKAADAETLARALLQSQTLKSLHVDGGQLQRTLFNLGLPLPNQLESLNTYVRHVDDVLGLTQTIAGSNLCELELGTRVPFETAVAMNLMHAITSLPRLRHLSMVHTALPLPSVVRLSERLPSLTRLRLYNTQLDDYGIFVLASALPKCRHLETLQIGSQKCSHVAWAHLARGLAQCRPLKQLSLRDSDIGSRGFIALLPVLRNLDNVKLIQCDISDDGALALCHVMDAADGLFELTLHGNPFSKGAVNHIVRAVLKRLPRWGKIGLTVER
ncbi:hypothetical protein SDRG_00064 [Saprolegnia diclina VS20]|uniref:Uncharacterized protein n=1 Tax=Saprolegnia diclina (strain VS20) TaxID=1156394 RepID=T0R791_SAPDV|nr:hypothetical protein SDRG_00064 [Saprolegnia diclina VS20]EQC42325.1 hypothetical protein SDRG_00064 [Saprolegnia diclina VS20]|eukprot:XP_008603748.1 hypothetical protein SDRG_00064 [Saprolegnia diclina VS20]